MPKAKWKDGMWTWEKEGKLVMDGCHKTRTARAKHGDRERELVQRYGTGVGRHDRSVTCVGMV